MAYPITAHECATARHTTRYLSAGLADGPLIVFVHGWPELAISWRHQIECFAALGFSAVAPDMRGYGGSTVHAQKAAYAMAEIVQDMVELLAHLGRDKAIWVGHDWGSPVVWSMASHHADKCLGVASLCVPYMPRGFTLDSLVPLIDRKVYPKELYPLGQWDYQAYYHDSFDEARAALEADPLRTVKALMRSGDAGAVPACGLRLDLRDARFTARRTHARPVQRLGRSRGRERPLDAAGETPARQRLPGGLDRAAHRNGMKDEIT